MISPKVMQNLTKTITQAIKSMAGENKGQLAALSEISKLLNKGGGESGLGKSTKEIGSTLLKVSKLVEAQTALLSEIKIPDASGDDDSAEQIKALEETVKKLTEENKKQAAEIESLMAEAGKAQKEAGGDKDATKKIKAATTALDKAMKLVEEQTKLLEEAKKALAG
jgi:predicted RNase H-like nuclease (RuvC/YqgF family)